MHISLYSFVVYTVHLYHMKQTQHFDTTITPHLLHIYLFL